MKEITAVAGSRVAIIRRAFSSVPLDYRFHAKTAVAGQVLSGSVEVKKSRWLMPGPLEKLSLEENNVVSAGMWNTFMSVDVVPDVEIVIAMHHWPLPNRLIIPLLIAAVIVIAVAGMAVFWMQ